jgi:hypothetical protein
MTIAVRDIVATPALPLPPQPFLLECFEARCWARSHLYFEHEFELHEAVDVLQQSAVAWGLVATIGQDEVQRIMARAFGEARQ